MFDQGDPERIDGDHAPRDGSSAADGADRAGESPASGCGDAWSGAPGPALAAALAAAGDDLEQVDDHALVDLVASWRRLSSWAAAGAARAAAELSGRDSMRPDWPEAVGLRGDPCVAAEELALRLGVSRRSAGDLVRTGQALEGALWPAAEALETGAIDEGKARVLVRHLADQPWEVALEVQARVLPSAPQRTHRQLAADVERALAAVDPTGADDRAARAAAERTVRRPRPLPDGMAGLWAVLPAPAALSAWGRLDGIAREVRAAGDDRTLDQLRADAMTALLVAGRLAAEVPGGGAGEAGEAAGAGAAELDILMDLLAGPAVPAEIRVTVPLDVLLDRNRTDAPGMAGAVVDAAGAAADVTGTSANVTGTAADVTSDSADVTGTAADVTGTAADVTGTSADAIGTSASADMTGAAAGMTGAAADATSAGCPGAAAAQPVAVLAADLEGYGPIAPATAAALAAGGTWRRVVTDPRTGAVLDVGTERYRPPPALDRHVRFRDGTCRRPGCSSAADGCDLDHTVPHGTDGGRTAADNLGALCRRDHLLKTHAGFRLVQVAPGTFEWLTPTGHRYVQPVGDALPAGPDVELLAVLHHDAVRSDQPPPGPPPGAPPPGERPPGPPSGERPPGPPSGERPPDEPPPF